MKPGALPIQGRALNIADAEGLPKSLRGTARGQELMRNDPFESGV
jgi:hypothetical protein